MLLSPFQAESRRVMFLFSCKAEGVWELNERLIRSQWEKRTFSILMRLIQTTRCISKRYKDHRLMQQVPSTAIYHAVKTSLASPVEAPTKCGPNIEVAFRDATFYLYEQLTLRVYQNTTMGL